MVWSVTSAPAAAVIWAVCALGWATVLLSTFLINHFDLFGLRQVWAYRRGQGRSPPADFKTPLFTGWCGTRSISASILAFWATPTT